MGSSPWLRRLKYYGFGFGLGLIFVFFFFQNRGCAWLPGNRVKNSILDRLVVVSDRTAADLKDQGISNAFILELLNDGDVLFDQSKKEGDSKVYVIEKDGKKISFTLPYESFLTEVKIGGNAKKMKTSNSGEGSIIHFPNDSTLIYPDSTALMTCQLEVLDFINSKEILKALKASGKVDFSKCNLATRPKPEHYLTLMKGDDKIGMKTIWYKNKLNVTFFDIPFDTNCN